MKTYTDQLGRRITLKKYPERIVSVVPSQTELLAEFGMEKKVVGITKFCIHPEKWFRNKTRIGGTKQLDIEKIIDLQPDLIIANKEENDKKQIEILAKYFPVWISDIQTLEDAEKMIFELGEICNQAVVAKKLLEKIKSEFTSLEKDLLRKGVEKTKAVYFIWRKPYMTVGGDTFINSMLEAGGFENLFKNKKRYPETNLQALKTLDPSVILLSSEPFPFKQEHVLEIKKELPQVKIRIVDGEMFSWYGSRLKLSASYFKKLKTDI